jgi:hypothetical protein
MLKVQFDRQKRRFAALVLTTLLWETIGFTSLAQAQNTSLSPKFSPDPTELKGAGGGSVAAKEIAGLAETPTGGCLGFMNADPNHTIELKAFFSYLSIQVQSAQDTTIVVTGPGGTWCNDDFQDKNAGLEGQWLPGTYQVWVGTYNRDKSTPYTLRISETR